MSLMCKMQVFIWKVDQQAAPRVLDLSFVFVFFVVFPTEEVHHLPPKKQGKTNIPLQIKENTWAKKKNAQVQTCIEKN